MTIDLVAFGKLVWAKRKALDWSGEALAAEALRNSALKGKVSEVENGRGNSTDDTIRKYCRALGITAADLPGLSAILHDPASGQETIDQLIRDKGSLEAALHDARDLHRGALIALADRFGIADPSGRKDHELRAELAKRAEDYLNLLRELEELRAKFPRLGNILSEALAMLDQGPDRANEVRAMIKEARASFRSSVLLDAIEQDADMADVEAAAALAEGDVEGAFHIFSAAADMFQGVDPDQVVERWLRYAGQLFQHGLRRGGPGLALSERMTRDALARIDAAKNPDLWARAQNNLAAALQTQGSRQVGAAGVELLGQAVDAYRAALWVFTEEKHSVNWAKTMQNLAGTLRNQGNRQAGAAGVELLAQAVEAYGAALRVFTETEHRVYWAAAMQNLAIALRHQGSRQAGAAGLELLAKAVEAYGAALRVFTEVEHPVEWAVTKQNLAGALATQGGRQADVAGLDLLEQAADAFHAALRVRTKSHQPARWAMTQANLAELEKDWAEHPACTDPLPHLRAGLGYIEAALTVYDPEHMSHDHQKASEFRDRLLAAIAALS